MQLKNTAAWILREKAKPFEVAKAPFPDCGDDELIIQSFAVAINPVDWKVQDSGGFGLSYPFILGEDVVGVVIEVGSNLGKKYKVGDRVLANALGFESGAKYGGFQTCPVVRKETVCPIPDDVAFDEAVVLPLSVSTAAAGLYMKATLELDFPLVESKGREGSTKEKEKPWLLLWGGSSSVGSSVIQLASASGYNVITTASPANYEYCYELGAKFVLDYHNPAIVEIATGLLKGKTVVGAYDAIGADATVVQCANVLHELGGGTVVSVSGAPEDLPKGTNVVRISSSSIVSKEQQVAKKVWEEFLPEALRKGVFKPAPSPLVVGRGLKNIQKGLDRQKEGVSAKKVVVLLGET